MPERALRGPEGEPGQDGRPGRDGIDGPPGKDGERGADGANGTDGRDGMDGKNGIDGKDGEDGKQGPQGEPGPRGPDGKPGKPGKDGQDGQDGLMGPMPDHRWRGTELAFQNPDGSFGRYVDLRGPQGAGGFGSSSGAGMTKTQVLQLNTLLAIVGGWISAVPDAAIEEVTIDELDVTVEGSANGFYSSIPGGEPVEAQYEWDWGDDSMTVDELTAEHTYAEAGTYAISFRAKNHIGWSEPVTEEVTVTDVVPTDPFWADVLLLVATQGADIVDYSGRHTLAQVGPGAGDITVADGVMNWPGNAALSVSDNQSDWSFPGDFTIELWAGPQDTTDFVQVFDNYSVYGQTWVTYLPPTGQGFYSSVSRAFEDGDQDNRDIGQVKYCWQKSNGLTQLFLNDQLVGQFEDSAPYSDGTLPYMVMGARANLADAYLKGPTLGGRITNAARYAVVADSIEQDTWPVPTN